MPLLRGQVLLGDRDECLGGQRVQVALLTAPPLGEQPGNDDDQHGDAEAGPAIPPDMGNPVSGVDVDAKHGDGLAGFASDAGDGLAITVVTGDSVVGMAAGNSWVLVISILPSGGVWEIRTWLPSCVGDGCCGCCWSTVLVCGRRPRGNPGQDLQHIPLHRLVQSLIPELVERQCRALQQARGGTMVRSVDRCMRQVL